MINNYIVRKPKIGGPHPTVLFVQGLGMTMHEWNNSFDEISTQLVGNGFQTVQFEFPNVIKELPLVERSKIVENVAKQYRPTGLLAQSYGAITALTASLPIIQSQVLVSPALSPVQSILRLYTEKGAVINYQGDTSLPRSSGETTTVGKEFWKDIERFDDTVIAQKIFIPTCILHGDQDTKISVETVQNFFNSIPTPNKKLKIYLGGDHGINEVPRPMREEFLSDVVAWFNKTL